MTSRTTKRFRKLLAELPGDVRLEARNAYRLWTANPWHPSLQFKQVHATEPIFSARIGLHWRAVGVRTSGEVVWFFVGSHADYDRLLRTL